MHKRNIMLTALFLAAVIAGLFWWLPSLNHSDILGLFYFPAILLAVIFSGGSHSPSEVAGWSGFLTYTISYWVIFIITYVFLLEIYLLRKVISETFGNVTLDFNQGEMNLKTIGKTLKRLEELRSKHFLLAPMTGLDMDEDDKRLAAIALINSDKNKPVQRLLWQIELKIAKNIGNKDEASMVIGRLKEDARNLMNAPDLKFDEEIVAFITSFEKEMDEIYAELTRVKGQSNQNVDPLVSVIENIFKKYDALKERLVEVKKKSGKALKI